MNARIEIKRHVHPRFNARRALAAAQLRLAAAIDRFVAGWLERCAADIEAAQRLFEAGAKPARDCGMGVGLAGWNESL
jgi:hypothetical protein